MIRPTPRLPVVRPSGNERSNGSISAPFVRRPPPLARKFLYVVAALIMFAVAGLFAYRLFGNQMMRMAFVPTSAFRAMPNLPGNAYGDPKMWIARPDKPGNPGLWAPKGYQAAAAPEAAVFFIHPTSYLARAHWNAPLDDQESKDRAACCIDPPCPWNAKITGAGAVRAEAGA